MSGKLHLICMKTEGSHAKIRKSQVIWVSIGNKQLDPPWKKLDPP